MSTTKDPLHETLRALKELTLDNIIPVDPWKFIDDSASHRRAEIHTLPPPLPSNEENAMLWHDTSEEMPINGPWCRYGQTLKPYDTLPSVFGAQPSKYEWFGEEKPQRNLGKGSRTPQHNESPPRTITTRSVVAAATNKSRTKSAKKTPKATAKKKSTTKSKDGSGRASRKAAPKYSPAASPPHKRPTKHTRRLDLSLRNRPAPKAKKPRGGKRQRRSP